MKAKKKGQRLIRKKNERKKNERKVERQKKK